MNQYALLGLYFLSGICAYAMVMHTVVALRRPFDRLHLLFSFLCLLLILFALAHGIALKAENPADFIYASRWSLSIGFVFYSTLSWVIAEFTRVYPTPWLVGNTSLFFVLFIVNLFQPYTLQFNEFQGLAHIVLPWGELFSRPIGTVSSWSGIAFLALLSAFAFSFYVLASIYRRGRRQAAIFMGLSILFLMAGTMQGMLVRYYGLDILPLGVYSYLAMVIGMGMVINHEDRQRRLHEKAIFDQLPAVVYVKNLDGRYLMANRHFEDALDVSDKEITGKTDHDLFPYEQAESIHANDQEVIVSNQAIDREEIVQHGGELHTYHSVKFPLLNNDGSIFAVCGISTDISDRKRSDQLLLASEQRYRTLFDSAYDAIFLMHGEVFIDCNAKACSLLGCAREEIIGNTPWVFSPHKQPDGQDSLAKAQAKMGYVYRGEAMLFEWQHCQHDGNLFDAEVSLTSIKLGDEICLLAIVRDITERKRAELAVQDSANHIQMLFDSSPAGLSLCDMEGQFIEVNPAFARIVGYSVEELLKLDYLSILAEKCHAQEEQDQRTLKTEGFYGPVDKVLRHRDGRLVPVEMAGKLIDRDNQQQIWSYTLDLSDEKAAQKRAAELNAQLMQAAKMEAIGHLTGGIAHDFNNILAVIQGYASLSRRVLAADGPESDKARNYIAEILSACERATTLTQQMLAFSRLAPDSQEKDAPVILLQPVVKEVVNLLGATIPATMSVNYRIEKDDLKAAIRPHGLHQVLLNLGINARDAIDEYGNIEFTLLSRMVSNEICNSCGELINGEYVELIVADSGGGISEENLPRIFNPFFTTKPVGKGSGMGLPMVHGVIHDSGGHIAVKSETGKGTTISILLPISKGERLPNFRAGAEENDIELDYLKNLRIMVVDDENCIAELLNELLAGCGANVSVYTHSPSALAGFLKTPQAVDIVITDEAMPELSGMDMVRRMKKVRGDIPIILCTGFSEHATEVSAAEVGIAAFMKKPVDSDALVQKIAELCARSQ